MPLPSSPSDPRHTHTQAIWLHINVNYLNIGFAVLFKRKMDMSSIKGCKSFSWLWCTTFNKLNHLQYIFLGNERVHTERDLWLGLYCRRSWMLTKRGGISFRSISWIESFCEAGCDGVRNVLVVEHYIRKPDHLGRNAQLFEAFIFLWVPTQPVVIPLLQRQDRELCGLHYP